MKKQLILSAVCLMAFYGLQAQQRTIGGIVRDSETNNPLSGVSVTIRETAQGVSTGEDGRYSIRASPDQVLVYSLIGKKSHEIRISNETPAVLDVALEAEDIVLDEIVAVGYGTTRKRDLAGAIVSLNPDNAKAGVVGDATQLLKGRAAGVQVRQNSLEPGGSVSVRIRGASSVSAENEPLYVVDGFQMDNINHINPDDIQSIEILKDASTTAIYGSRGANGVLLITTRSGKTDRFSIDYSFNQSNKRLYNHWELLDAGETIALDRKLFEETPSIISSSWTAEEGKYRGKGTDWFEETTRPARTERQQLSIAGGSDRVRAFASANYFNEPGVLLNTEYNRFGGRANIDFDIAKNLRAGVNTNFATSKQRYQEMGARTSEGNIIYQIFNLPPWRDKDGQTVFGIQGQRASIFNEMEGSELYLKHHSMYGSVFGELDVLPSLTLRGQYTYGYDHTKNQRYFNRATSVGKNNDGQAAINNGATNRQQLESILTWHQKFAETHDVKVIGGASYSTQEVETGGMQAFGFASDVFSFHNIGAAAYRELMSSGRVAGQKASFFGRAEYVFNNRYILNASLRADGSSVFGVNYRWGHFPAASVAWHLGDEAFMDFAKPVFSTVKLRGSYGLSGNDGIRAGLSRYQFAVRNVYVGGSQSVTGMIPINPYNPDLRWESTAQANIGADFAILGGRIEVGVDYYVKKTKDLLNATPIHPSGGFPNYWADGRGEEFVAMVTNDGNIENRGFELHVKSANIAKGDFSWTSAFNLATNRSLVTKLNNGQARYQYIRPHGSYDVKEYIILQEGSPLSALYGYVFDGVIQQGETYGPQPNSVPGDPKFRDLNGDGVIDEDDRKVLGHGMPSMVLGFGNTFTYKGFDFSLFLDASLGGHLLNLTRVYMEDYNRLKASEDRWTPGGRVLPDGNGGTYTSVGNPSDDIPRKGYQRTAEVQYGSYINSRFVENSDYLKLRNVELGYTPPLRNWGNAAHYVKTLRVFVGAQNLLTFTKYTGFDPDISTNGGSAIAQGLDLNAYPAYRMVNFGAKITF